MTKKRVLLPNKEAEFFNQYEGVVFGVLKRLSIHPTNPDYEEYVQTGRLRLVEAYEEFQENPWKEEHINAFVSYAFTKIRWGILDHLRQNVRIQQREQEWDDSFNHTLSFKKDEFVDQVLEKEWFTQVLSLLNPSEKRLVVYLCNHQLTITAIARKEGVSRKTIYKRRNQIKQKLIHTIYPEKGKLNENNHN